MYQRLITYWVYGGALAGVLLVFLTPALASSWTIVATLIFLHLPAYMLHQYEEHDDDRFRRFFNTTIGKGREVLSLQDVFLINVPWVWGVVAVSFWLALGYGIGWWLVAVYLVLVNALVHILSTLVLRRYNPGLVTAVVVFLPLSILTLWQIQATGGGTFSYHMIGLTIAVAIHGAILALVRMRLARKG